jgi:predicted O-methyltransferase YrrM
MISQIISSINDSPEIELCDPLKNIPDGMILEFGVAGGESINKIARATDRRVYGFDSFLGLPEDWRPEVTKGTFSQSSHPDVEPNVELVVGMFEDTLPKFLQEHPGEIAFIHIDCDLYSSTKTIFDNVKDRIADGVVLAFDEIRTYSGYEEHEVKAFSEFLQETGYKWECIGHHGGERGMFRIHK